MPGSDLCNYCGMRRVLVVDDEENIRLVLRTLLRKNDYEVEVAPDAKAALGKLG